MRVLHIITRMIIGGAQENTLYNCLDLLERHCDNVLLATGPAEGREGKLLTEGRAGGLDVVEVPSLQRAIHPGQDRAAFRELTKIIVDFQPDVVHTHSAKGGFLGRAAAWKRNVPAVLHSVHGAPFHPFQNVLSRRLFVMLERWAAKRCHKMICVADAMTDLMVAARVAPREKFTTIYSGMDVEPFLACRSVREQARKELGFADDEIVFGKIARLFNLKGHEYLIDAAAKVVARNPKCRFLFVGDGILRESLEQRIARHGLQKHFSCTGLVPPERIPYYLSSMDCLVHTSLREGLARTLPQALISGRPVISYDVDGAREVAIDGETGYLLPAKAIDPLAEAILAMASDKDRRQAMGQEGTRRFTEQFRHENMTQQIRDVYQSVLDSRP